MSSRGAYTGEIKQKLKRMRIPNRVGQRGKDFIDNLWVIGVHFNDL